MPSARDTAMDEASDASSPVGLVDAEAAGTPAASTLTTVSDEMRDRQLAEMRVDRDDWKEKAEENHRLYLEERNKNRRMTREIAGGGDGGSTVCGNVKTMDDIGDRIGEHGAAWLAGLLNWWRYEFWVRLKCMPAGFQNWKPDVQYHCSFYWAAKIMTDYGGWPDGLEAKYVWTTWIVPALCISLNSWRASTIRKFTSLVEDGEENIFDHDLDEFIGDYDHKDKASVVEATLDEITADVIREKYIVGKPQEFCEMVHRFAWRVNGSMSNLGRQLRDRNTKESKNLFKAISMSDIAFALLLFVIKGEQWKERLDYLEKKKEDERKAEAAKGKKGSRRGGGKRKADEVDAASKSSDKRNYTLGRKGWLIGNRARDRKQGLTDLAVKFYNVVKEALKEIDMEEWEEIWKEYYPTIKGAGTKGFAPPKANVWEGDGLIHIAGLKVPRFDADGELIRDD